MTNAGQSALYDFQALSQEDADRQARVIEEKMERVLDLLSLEYRREMQITYVNGPMIPGPHCKLSIMVPVDRKGLDGTNRLDGLISSAVEFNPRIPLASRWFRKSLIAIEYTDVFLSAWISLEALAEERNRALCSAEEAAIDQVRECVKSVVSYEKFPNLRSRMIQDWLDTARKQSIPESMAEVIKRVLGPEYKLLGQPLDECMRDLQNNRSKLVHNAEPIPDVCEKACAIRDLAWRILHALARGKDFLQKLNAAAYDDLLKIQDFGPVLVNRLLEERDAVDGFDSLDQLRCISGIGEERLAALRVWAMSH